MMKQGGNARPLDACYNVQTAVDEKNKLIVDFEVTNCPDEKGALPKMTEKTKELMGVSEIIVLTDKGYFDPEDNKLTQGISAKSDESKPFGNTHK
jgi:hypothetical protein